MGTCALLSLIVFKLMCFSVDWFALLLSDTRLGKTKRASSAIFLKAVSWRVTKQLWTGVLPSFATPACAMWTAPAATARKWTFTRLVGPSHTPSGSITPSKSKAWKCEVSLKGLWYVLCAAQMAAAALAQLML